MKITASNDSGANGSASMSPTTLSGRKGSSPRWRTIDSLMSSPTIVAPVSCASCEL